MRAPKGALVVAGSFKLTFAMWQMGSVELKMQLLVREITWSERGCL